MSDFLLAIRRHGLRVGVTLVPLLFALLHATGTLHIGVIQTLDNIIYDARLRLTMPRTMDDRVVIVDIDEKSLAEIGRWPWSRDHVGTMLREILGRQGAAIVGFDVVFAEPDTSSGLAKLQQLAQTDLQGVQGFAEKVDSLRDRLDFDAAFARALSSQPVVLGYYFSSDRDGRRAGVLPQPVMNERSMAGRSARVTKWNGYGSNLAQFASAAPKAGFFNAITDDDGVVRSLPLIAEFEGRYYESLALAMFRHLLNSPVVEPGFPKDVVFARKYNNLESLILKADGQSIAIPVDDKAAALVPFRGNGGPSGGSFRYVPASDLVLGRLPEGNLKNRIVLVGTTAPGLLDLRVTPISEAYPGVETHANLISGMLDGKILVKPDYALGFEVVALIVSGLVLALGLPLLSASRAVLLSAFILVVLVGVNMWLYLGYGLALPLASSIVLAVLAFAMNMSFGYFVESRSKRELANLFGTYVPPELVDEMVKDPDSYSMKAENRELTVMFSDMRGFTKLSEKMDPVKLQDLLNRVFSRLSTIIRQQRGTIDKYMGDCVMAFWGAPVPANNHATLALLASMEMVHEITRINAEHKEIGLPEIGVGVGLNSGPMCVGDMGSDVRRSYTVIGDAVNLGSRLESLTRFYGVDIIVSEATRKQAEWSYWLELDRVRVKGKAEAVAIFSPLTKEESESQKSELRLWHQLLSAYRSQDWEQAELLLLNLERISAKKVLCSVYKERVAYRKSLPFDPSWDGTTDFETK
ncbi:MAG: adenylate/guanylate cyclase domain-containing protein [Burkholderiaceae bacterium]|nr:adenylate/guanylate cyclase domain-containing protein [Burkholderiaceae bacterium]